MEWSKGTHHLLAHVPLLCCLEVIRSEGISAWGRGKREGQRGRGKEGGGKEGGEKRRGKGHITYFPCVLLLLCCLEVIRFHLKY